MEISPSDARKQALSLCPSKNNAFGNAPARTAGSAVAGKFPEGAVWASARLSTAFRGNPGCDSRAARRQVAFSAPADGGQITVISALS